MMSKGLLSNNDNVELLAKKFKELEYLKQLDDGQPEYVNLAAEFQLLEEYFITIFEEQIPNILKAQGKEEIEDGLIEIEFALRHILYGIYDTKYLRESTGLFMDIRNG